MGLFFPMDDERRPEGRRHGFARYRQLLERDWKAYILTDFIALATFIPYGLGVLYAVLTESSLVLIPVSLIGGAIAGQGIAVMYDFLLRRARDDLMAVGAAFKKSLRQNFRAALLPGAVEGLFVGLVIFSGFVMWRTGRITALNVAVFAVAVVVFTMVFDLLWPQVVLFEQRPAVRLKNCALFILQNPWRVLGGAVLQTAWWAVTFLFMPWTAFLAPFLGVWYILFVTVCLKYDALDGAFQIEAQISAKNAGPAPENGKGADDHD